MALEASLVSRPLQDFIAAVEKNRFSPRLQDKLWEWPGDEANLKEHCTIICLSGYVIAGAVTPPSAGRIIVLLHV